MYVRPAKSQSDWDSCISRQPDAILLQSWAWGQFQQKLGRTPHYLLFGENDQPQAGILVIEQPLFGPFTLLYTPRPTLAHLSAKQVNDLILALAQWAKAQPKAVFLRLEPNDPAPNPALSNLLRSQGWLATNKEIQPHHTIQLSLKPSVDRLLDNMKPKTRYNIRLAEKHGVTIKELSPKDIAIFNRLIKATGERDAFNPHPASYYQTQFETLYPDYQKLFIAWQDNKPLAGLLAGFYANTAIYMHGASDYQHRNLMAPYLLQWHTIQYAKEKGFTIYDLWGAHPDPRHRWAGVTRFKAGFNGKDIAYLPVHELPLKSPWYGLYRFISRLK